MDNELRRALLFFEPMGYRHEPTPQDAPTDALGIFERGGEQWCLIKTTGDLYVMRWWRSSSKEE